MLERARRICLSLPDVVEVTSWGHPNWRAGRKIFSALEVYKGELCLCFKTTLAEQEALVNDPRFFASPYVGHHGWVSMRVGQGRLDWGLIETLLVGAYRRVATRRCLAVLDTRGRRRPRPAR